MLPISKTYQPLPHLYGGRELGRSALYDWRGALVNLPDFASSWWYKVFVATNLRDQTGFPLRPLQLNTNTERTDGSTDHPHAHYLHRLFALRGKIYGILAPFEATRAATGVDGSFADDESTRLAENVPTVDTSLTVRFTFSAPLPTLQPSERVRILGRTYTVARLEYNLPTHGSPTLTGYFYPTS